MNKDGHLQGAIYFGLLGFFLWFILYSVVFLISTDIDSNHILVLVESRPLDMLIGSALMFPVTKISSALPDIIDPPGGRHRGIGHSRVLLAVLWVIFLVSLYDLVLHPQETSLVLDLSLLRIVSPWLVYFFSLGYISHLIYDAFTPVGLT